MNAVQKLWAYGFVWPFSQVYRFTAQGLWNILGNGWHCLRLLISGRRDFVDALMHLQQDRILVAANMPDTLMGVQQVLSSFEYKLDGLFPKGSVPIFDRWPTWTQLPRIHVFMEFHGNCQDSVAYTRWIMRGLNEELRPGRRFFYRTNIYVPINPVALFTKTHYFVSILAPDGTEYQVSNGRITKETRDELATRYLNAEHKYIWLTNSVWSD